MYYTHIHTTPQEGGVSFQWFNMFLQALTTAPAVVIQYETSVRYGFHDGLYTDYRLRCDPVQHRKQTRIQIQTATCLERPLVYLQIFESDPIHQVKSSSIQANTFKQLVETTLVQQWTITLQEVVYVLTKSATGTNKEGASLAVPRFDIMSVSTTLEDLPDLFGRFRQGCAEELSIRIQPYQSELVTKGEQE